MKRSVIETVLGGFVIFLALAFLAYSYNTSNVAEVNGYQITADFSGIGGLQIGDEVQISGVKVGQVANLELDPKAYVARVTMEIDNKVQIPSDTTALISSESLLGGKYLLLEPGGAEDMLKNGGKIEFTQAPQNLEQLLGQFIFSMNKDNDSDKTSGNAEVKVPEYP
jgi:phospholipid/cholesterol/gamma-HCH transport system substrate-binding protein